MSGQKVRWRPWAAAGLLLSLALLGWGWLTPGGLWLTCTPVKGGPPALALPLEPGEPFTLNYIHSVDHAPIWEVHTADRDGRIFVEEERFVMVGAGMGDLPGRGRFTGRDGVQVIENLHYPLGGFVLRVGSPGVDHTIIWRGQRFNLSAGYAGRALLVAARPINLLEKYWLELTNPATPGANHARP
ncbi:MAG: DUF1850 domain-containing protein [Deltaproteobacteria bacterium]|nr:DUF1850 domain-containing protein [Deltaproteobacteria bacterium]